MATRTSLVSRNASLNAMVTRLASGLIRIYTGSQPATPETAASGTLLGTLTFGSTAGDVSAGVMTARAITQDSSADASGTAGWFRVLQSDGSTVEFDGACGESGSGAECIMNETDIVAGGVISITALTYTLPM